MFEVLLLGFSWTGKCDVCPASCLLTYHVISQVTTLILYNKHILTHMSNDVRGFGHVRIVVRTSCLFANGEASEVEGRILVGTKKLESPSTGYWETNLRIGIP